MANSCPRCAAGATDTMRMLELAPDSRSDETTVYLERCPACSHRFLAYYEESRRGALGEDHWNYHQIECTAATWERLEELIASCSTPRDPRCGCAAHQQIGAVNAMGYWVGLPSDGSPAPLPVARPVEPAPTVPTVPKVLVAQHAAVRAVAWSPEGTRIAVATGDGRVSLRDAVTGDAISSGRTKQVRQLWWDQELLSLGGDGITVWDEATMRAAPRLALTDVRAAEWSPDRARIAIARKPSTLEILDATSGACTAACDISGGANIHALAWSPDGTIVVCGTDRDHTIHAVAAASGAILWRRDHGQVSYSGSGDPFGFPDEERAAEVHALAFTADGRVLVCAGEGEFLTLWSPAGDDLGTIAVSGWTSVAALAVSADSATVAAGDRRGDVRVAQLWAGGSPLLVELCDASIEALAFSPDGRSLAAGDSDGRVHIVPCRPR